MTLEVNSNNGYQNIAKPIAQPRAEVAPADTGAGISITEVPTSSRPISDSQVTGATGKEKKTAKDSQIKDAISQANSKLKSPLRRTTCEFSYHEETKRISIKVIDQDTHKIIREIPPEETLEMLEKMWELAGILVDEKR